VADVLPALDLHEFRAKFTELHKQRQEARHEHRKYSEEEATHERAFRKTLAVAFATAKGNGLSDKRAEIEARAAAADHAFQRDIAHSLAVSAKLRIEEIERASASLRHISERSERES
jgi:hypothetical protein